MQTVIRKTTILGGLPVFAKVSFGFDEYLGESWADVDEIYWCRSNRPGKSISQHVFDRAEKYDPYFANLIEDVNEQIAWEHEDEQESRKEVNLR